MVQSAGRPRNADLDVALIKAAEELILDRGLSAVSVEAVSARAGTTRPAFYRRFDGIPDLILALLLERFATELDAVMDFGSLPADLEAIQREQVALFADPLVTSSFTGFLDSLHTNDQLRQAFLEKFLGPRRAAVAAIIRRAESRGEIPEGADVEWICDLITGPLVMRILLPGLLPLDDALVSNTVASALHALGYQSS
ncbi:TetR/AcrR family transcriptional regulator [Arthrobacter sp. CJ23]|uniref:TetR/AcrR family transcriptional regulator n=1 Tax=Arthrobacter sp. CJ23 TaxID=2972479 RepID=UPI00215BCD0E|nr:TetR/AcrR family transcriptional regulator [Arthrobacter sp. CJ23]UVJ40019.1 TetR/AcrR family transcriptional regulator [Arthrobacter sp. CJ23]